MCPVALGAKNAMGKLEIRDKCLACLPFRVQPQDSVVLTFRPRRGAEGPELSQMSLNYCFDKVF